ncbi:MAG: 16S rRNA (guanine(966)-N(2))-methyltransferase RsmD [Peptostreptococcaceae bacterium]|nr:16S rRNA (guanine(966)-N(2))-methyltransferase RsmD [Peptostreptococcaceae bacterium]
MKITTGGFKYRNLTTPKGYDVRPTSEKVREAIFSMIGVTIGGANVLDLFAGTGSLGLEALSRGADKCTFNDNSAKSLQALNENIENCKAEELSTVFRGDFKRTLDRMTEPFDIIFLDPPYKAGFYDDAFVLISQNNLLKEDGLLIVEHNKRDGFDDEKSGFIKIKEKRYGTIGVSVFKIS